MGDALPPLRSDLIIEAVAPTAGDPAYDVSSPDLTRTHRVTSQAYLALSMIDGRKDFVGWASAVQQMYPELDLVQLHHLANEVSKLGYFSHPAQLPAQPGPMVGAALIRDLSEEGNTGLPPISYDPNAATMPGTSLPPITAPPTDEMSPEMAMDLMFTAPSGTGAPVASKGPSAPIAGAPAPVTAVNQPNPLAGGGGEELFLPDDPSDSIDMDVDVDFGSAPPAPAGAAGGDGWTAPPTPVPIVQGQPATGSPPPAMPGAGVDPFSMTDPAMAAQNTDSFPPLVASMPSGEGRGPIPKAWANLAVDHTESKDLVAVTGPEKGIPFQIYELEHRMLQLMDGTRDQAKLLEDVRAMGHPIDAGQLMSFIRQMDAYGFLESTGPLQRKIERERMWAPKPPDDSLTKAPWPEEERRLFQVGLGHFRDGRTDKAVSFFEALLEINPENPEAHSMLELIQGRRPTVSALEDSGGTLGAPAGPQTAAGVGPVGGATATQVPAPGGPAVTNLASAGVTNFASGGVGSVDDFSIEAPDSEVATKKKGGFLRWAAVLLVLVVGAAVGGLYVEQPSVVTVSVALGGPAVETVTSPVAGTVRAMRVKKGQAVKKGEVVASIAAGQTEELGELAGAVELIETTLAEQPDGSQSKRKVGLALKKAKKALKKLEGKESRLLKYKNGKSKRKAASAAKKINKLMPELNEGRREVRNLSQQYEALKNALPAKEVAALEAQLKEKRAARDALREKAAVKDVVAPSDGVVFDDPPPVAVGTEVAASQPLLRLTGSGGTVELFVPEDVMELAPGGKTVLVTFGEVKVPVQIEGLSPQFETRDGVKGNVMKARPKGALPATLAKDAVGSVTLEGPPRPLTIQAVEQLNRRFGLGLPVDF